MIRFMSFLIVLWTILNVEGSAYAYLDPGSTSMIWQLLLGALATVVVFFKVFWHKLSAFFGSSKNKTSDSKTSKAEDVEP